MATRMETAPYVAAAGDLVAHEAEPREARGGAGGREGVEAVHVPQRGPGPAQRGGVDGGEGEGGGPLAAQVGHLPPWPGHGP